MCGIVSAIARHNIVPVLIEGLRRLEYRGYDSCGIAVLTDGAPRRVRSIARVEDLAAQVEKAGFASGIGLAHTRWATHGAPVPDNAHPIFSRETIALAHNGIIENHEALRKALSAQGYTFVSQTDSEVIAHLIHSLLPASSLEHFSARLLLARARRQYGDRCGRSRSASLRDGGDPAAIPNTRNDDVTQCKPLKNALADAVRAAVQQLRGAYAIAVFHSAEPHCIVGARRGSPLVVGIGEEAHFLASDAIALAGETERFIFLEDGDVVELTADTVNITDSNGARAERELRVLTSLHQIGALGPYQHFMQKEIFEQPRALAESIAQRDTFLPSCFGERARAVFERIDRALILACGSSYYAGLTAKYWLESIAALPTQVEIASEYRYRSPVPHPDTLVVAISQSGETADTLAALKYAHALGQAQSLAICNVATSAMVRQTALSFLTRAGAEIGVASTKAFTAQLAALFILTVTLGKVRARVAPSAEDAYRQQLRHLPVALNRVLALEPHLIAWAETFAGKENALFLGRGMHYPIALEGALKLKEISYIHAEAYPAGELKHGPLALVTDAMPVVAIAPNDALLEKLKSNLHEVRARGGQLYALAEPETRIDSDIGLRAIRMPEHEGPLSPLLHAVALQLLAYHTARARGTDIDKPRNLAKSVTVE
ncbi:Glucosamine--fructose-6-phosphate aminotransferase (isomerizing) (Hexosephosphate aminotransferase) (D-fructose-6-phosphate amidotransferase) (GFAT) (L-glutamine-D-fructose-6-phosphate amidotransferase) (Glucosamine-6-phosphate synthase) [Candidatus Glomeribacter gigasporarum BEG34]|uniref:Glutamine--fructose-6-phosphate aminotransferase [isomerizing] n=1 Tax=Candidatus Glomeribacter gigasporarum BEG34 TaxID=1070319 RepID=G2J7F0_9BURK|nr:glutamine--fructose-6-phosphate transaminase (isomerizing) [Candidatus Glomeribacter gigasporarum]CCD28695.1 Glucosamine--fructose-6-phosphate aminotransferase (isomerizing) (Hexosephosphate aminotransferase) (D-fructose-6-phosphate amidotransferase) (GFAT) (L-glutamine-D-fructose-6-phosphate amidotransferase) (Glucosamine-6-phosphate synthase) [Candidatus Glomeribacter gigasporarum BEG34]